MSNGGGEGTEAEGPKFAFHEAADNHGISHEDSEHAIRNARLFIDLEDDRVMAIGPATNGATELEVGFRPLPDGTLYVFHSMKARPGWG